MLGRAGRSSARRADGRRSPRRSPASNASILRTARFASCVIKSVPRACEVSPAARGDVCEPSACLSTSATCLPALARWNATLDPSAPDPITTHSLASIIAFSKATCSPTPVPFYGRRRHRVQGSSQRSLPQELAALHGFGGCSCRPDRSHGRSPQCTVRVAVPTLDAGCLGRLIHRTGAGTEGRQRDSNGAAEVIQLEGGDVIEALSGLDKP